MQSSHKGAVGRPGQGEEVPILDVPQATVFAGECLFLKIELRSRAQWDELWRGLVARQRLRLPGPLPAGLSRAVLLFSGPPNGECLPLPADLLRSDDYAVEARLGRIGLSTRMAAVRLARALPKQEPQKEEPTGACRIVRRPALRELFENARLRLRPRISGAAEMIAPSSDLVPVVVVLRAEHVSLDEVQARTGVATGRLTRFLVALLDAGLLDRAPAALLTYDDPFAYFGLHWSAHEHEIRSRYQELKTKLEEFSAPPETLACLEETFDKICKPEQRTALRRELYPPPISREIADHYRASLVKKDQPLEQRIDTCRRLLELSPEDRDVRALLVQLLSRQARDRRITPSPPRQ